MAPKRATETVTAEIELEVVKITLLAPITLADPFNWDPNSGQHPPEFEAGAVVRVAPLLAQEMVGSGRARYVDPPADDGGPMTTARLSGAEDASVKMPRGRKAAPDEGEQE